MTKSKIITSLPFGLVDDISNRIKQPGNLDVMQKFYTATFNHSQFQTGLDLLSETHSMSGLDNAGLIVTGIPGVGKSRLLNTYVKNTYAKEYYQPTDELTPLPILIVKLPGRPTIPRVIEKILMSSEHLIPGARRTDSLERRLHQLITHQRSEMFIFDEFQHLLPKNASRQVANATINFLKTLADDYKLAFCFAGLPHMSDVLNDFEEIKDRLAFGELNIKPFAVDTKFEKNDFSKYLNSMFTKIESLDVDCSELRSNNMDRTILLFRMLIATGGKARHISMLFAKALMKLTPGDSLTNKCFEDVFTKSTAINRGGVFNPFSAKKQALIKQINILKVIEKTKMEAANAK